MNCNFLCALVLMWIWLFCVVPLVVWEMQWPPHIHSPVRAFESFEVIPEVQRMWIRPLPDLQSPDLLASSKPTDVYLWAPEKWGTFPARLSARPSPITIRALPGTDSFVIQTIRWRDASPSAKTPHGNRLGAFDVTQTLTWSGQRRTPLSIAKLPPKESKPIGQKDKEKSTSNDKRALRANDSTIAQTTQVSTNDVSFPATVNSLEWKWIESNAIMPLESLFHASPYVDPMKINDLQKTSQWNILYANQTPLCLFHLEPWTWK